MPIPAALAAAVYASSLPSSLWFSKIGKGFLRETRLGVFDEDIISS
jgi:hypothetical protein